MLAVRAGTAPTDRGEGSGVERRYGLVCSTAQPGILAILRCSKPWLPAGLGRPVSPAEEGPGRAVEGETVWGGEPGLSMGGLPLTVACLSARVNARLILEGTRGKI